MAAGEPFAAFLSYSRGTSEQLAVDLQAGMERFAKPWYRLRAMRVFRDDSSMSANTALWSTIQTGLTQSGWFILLATPASAASPWVVQEIDWWLRNKGSRQLLIVQAEGDLYWDRAAGAFAPSSTAIPAILHDAYPEEPRWIDMRWYAADPVGGKSDPRFLERVADLSAAVGGVERDTLVGENVRQHRRSIRLARGAIVVLSLLLVLSLVAGVLALDQRRAAIAQRNEARNQANQADARGLAAQALALAGTQVDTALLLAVEAYRREASIDTESGLLAALNAARYLVAYRPELPPDGTDLALSPDRSTVLVLTATGDLHQYDTRTWRSIGEPLARGIKSAYTVGVSGDGTRAAYSGADGVHVLDLATRRAVGPTFGDTASRALITRDGSRVVWSSEVTGRAAVTDVATGRERTRIRLGTDPLIIDLRPGDAELSVGGFTDRPVLRRYRLDGTPVGPSIAYDTGGWITGLQYSPRGDRIVVTDNSGQSQLVDASSLKPVGRSMQVRGSRVTDVSFSPDGELVALAADDGSIRVHRTEDGSVRATLTGLTGNTLIEFLDEFRMLATTPTASAEFDLRRSTALGATVDRTAAVTDLVPRSSDDRLLVAQTDGISFLTRDLTETDLVPAEQIGNYGLLQGVTVSPDSSSYAIQGIFAGGKPEAFDGEVALVDATTHAVHRRIKIRGDEGPILGVTSLAFSPDGRRLAVGTITGLVSVVETSTGRLLVDGQRTDVFATLALVWSQDGERLFVGGQDGVLRGLDPVSGAVHVEIPLSPSLALSKAVPMPEPDLVAVASESGQVFLVDLASSSTSGAAYSAGGTQLQSVAITPDGTRLAAVSRDGRLRLWDRASRRPIGPPLAGHDDQTVGIAYLDGGRRLMTGGFDQRVIAWDMTPAGWVETACRLAGRDLTQPEWDQYLPGREYRRTCSE